MKIIPNQDFKHQAESYAKGEEYEVSEEDAEYFELCGWVGEQAEAGEHSLEIQNVVLGHEAEVN